jgi:1,4-dihydroxy-2-naphthoate octaprenyltransferase
MSAAYALSEGNLLITAVVSAPVLVWWWLFLVLMPGSYREAVLVYNEQVARERQ